MKYDEVLRGAVVGAGFMGETHLKGYSRLENVHIMAVIDPSKEQALKLAGPLGLATYESIDRATAELQLDFIDICAPTPFHVDLIASGFRNNCHVIVEKPLGASLEDIQKIIELSKGTDRRIMVAHVCRFMAIYMYARQTVESGRLGKPLAFSAKRYSEQPAWSIDNWIVDRKLSGGTLIDLSIHDIDISNWLLGIPQRLNASEVTRFENGPSHVMETIEYENGKVGQVEGSHLLPKGFPLTSEYHLVLEDGVVAGGTKNGQFFLSEFTGGEWTEIDPSRITRWDDPYTEELDHFISALHKGDPFRISLDEASQSVLSAISLKFSMESGKRVGLQRSEGSYE